jgi:hypothetical protein
MTATTRSFDLTALENTLFVSFELGEGRWALSFTSGFGEQVLRRSVRGRDCEAVAGAIQTMKERLGLARDARVVSCYEAGRDGRAATDSGSTGFSRPTGSRTSWWTLRASR